MIYSSCVKKGESSLDSQGFALLKFELLISERGLKICSKNAPLERSKGIGSAHDDPEIPLNLSTNMNFNSHFLFDAPQKIPSLNNAK